jgi:hypothetical protein
MLKTIYLMNLGGFLVYQVYQFDLIRIREGFTILRG